MPRFDFYQDTKIQTWERCHFQVEAESFEAARANSKAEKERKEKEAKEAKEHKEICERHLKEADEQTAEGKYADTLINLRQARLHCQTRIELFYKSV